jgi:hypothetical protein
MLSQGLYLDQTIINKQGLKGRQDDRSDLYPKQEK